MASPQSHLPPPIPPTLISTLLTTLSLPAPTTILPLQVTAAFHSIYLITYTTLPTTLTTPNPDGSTTLVLRISGNHVPRKKTMNEVAILAWLKKHTSIPVPRVIRYDDTEDNVLGREFTLLEKIPGASVDGMYARLGEDAKVKLVAGLIDVLLELNAFTWNHVGGLQLHNGDVVPGPVLEDTFWLTPDITRYFGSAESIDTLNPVGPYDSHEGLVKGYIESFTHAIKIHDSLSQMRDLLPRLDALIGQLPKIPLNSTRLILAHKDLHFANIMATESGEITGILDWEFAGVVPALRWDPVRAFLWNGTYSDEAHEEKMRLRGVFEKELEKRGVGKWWEDGVTEDVESVWTVIRFVRAIVEVCPRGEKGDMVGRWKDAALEALTKLGV